MSESAQAFYLRLNNHKSFLTAALSELYHNAVLVDCTLTAKGGQLRAHQTVLSACSPYFKEIFSEHNTSQYPVIIIKDMPFADLKAIVEYIYCGEVTIPRQQLQSVLNNGALLQVKGLYEYNQDKLPEITEPDVEVRPGNQYKSNNCSDSKSNVRQNGIKYLENNSLNACESDGNISANEKETRKSRKGSEKCSNDCDRESENYSKTLSLTDVKTVHNNIRSYGEIIENNDNNKDSIKKEYSSKSSIKLMNGREILIEKSEKSSSETSLESGIINTNADQHYIEKSMTGKPVLKTVSGCADNIVPLMPFAPLQQSFMIDVNPNLNQASQPSKFCFGFIANKGIYNTATTSTTTTTTTTSAVSSDIDANSDIKTVENSKQQNQSQNELKEQINDTTICANNTTIDNLFNKIPSIEKINEKTFDRNQTQTQNNIRKRSLISATDEEQKLRVIKKRTSKECKDTTKQKGSSDRTDKRYDSPICHEPNVSKHSMKEHIMNTHTSVQQRYVCSVCQKEYGWKHALDRHIKSKHTAN